jgi:hypothetical protein
MIMDNPACCALLWVGTPTSTYGSERYLVIYLALNLGNWVRFPTEPLLSPSVMVPVKHHHQSLRASNLGECARLLTENEVGSNPTPSA